MVNFNAGANTGGVGTELDFSNAFDMDKLKQDMAGASHGLAGNTPVKKPGLPTDPTSKANNPYLSASPITAAGPSLVDAGSLSQLNLQGQSFDPYRSQALGDINAQSSSGLASAQSGLAGSGGLGAADRMALASQFNRNKIQGRQGAIGKFAGMEADSAASADKANQMFNAQAQNQNLYANQRAQQQADQNQFQADLANRDFKARGYDQSQAYERADNMLQRQLQASNRLSNEQIAAANKGGGGGNIIENTWDTISGVFGG